MKVSVIIPFDGYYHYLSDCLESLKDQNLDDLETLLIIDQYDEAINDENRKKKSF